MKHSILYYFLTLSLAFQIYALPVQEPQRGLAMRDASSVSQMDGRPLNAGDPLKPAVPPDAFKRGLKQVVNNLTGKGKGKGTGEPEIKNAPASRTAPVHRLLGFTGVAQKPRASVTLPRPGAGAQAPSPAGSQTPPPEDEDPAAGLAGPSNANAGPSNAIAGPSNANADEGPAHPPGLAGPSNANAGPSNAIAGPSNANAS
jgi:hypothetical protein